MLGTILKVVVVVILAAYKFIGMLINLMLKPFALLLSKLKIFFAEKLPSTKMLDEKFSAFHGFLPFALFTTALTFVIVTCCIYIFNDAKKADFVMNLIFSTTLGSILSLFQDGFDISPATLFAIAFSGFIFSACMDTLTKKTKDPAGKIIEEKAKFYIRIPCFLVYFTMAASLALMLSGVFQAVGNWGFNTIVNLYNQKSTSFFPVLGKILAMIPLIYVAMLLLLIAVKEYAESAVFGFVGFLLLLVCLLIEQIILKRVAPPSELTLDIIEIAILLGVIFTMEAVRPFVLRKFDEALSDDKTENKEIAAPTYDF